MRSGRLALSRHLICQSLLAGFLLLASGLHALAQESQMQQQETAALDRIGPWKLINTGIFVALLAWFLAKYAPRFFNARSADIMKAIKDSTGLKIQAEFRYSEIDKKMASLPDEVKRIREQADIEMQREHDRMDEQTQVEIGHMRGNASNEIEALRKEAAARVQMHTAQLALGLAERRLQDRFAKGGPENSLEDFVRLVEGRHN